MVLGDSAYQELKFQRQKLRQFYRKAMLNKDVISHGRHLGSFVHACHTRQEALAAYMMRDVIAEPYREALLQILLRLNRL